MKTSAEQTRNNAESNATKIPGGFQRSHSHNHYTTKRLYEKERDPELEAEIALARENGVPYIPPPTGAAGGNSNGKPPPYTYRRQVSEVLSKAAKVLERDADYDDANSDDDGVDGPVDKIYSKAVKNGVGGNGKAERKARSRGVSGCSIKKDGGRFEYGLDCIDMAFEEPFSDSDNTDMEAEYEAYEYADYVFKYSDKEIRTILQDYLLGDGNKEQALRSLEKFKITNDALTHMVKDLIRLTVETTSSNTLDLGSRLLEEIVREKWISGATLLDAIREVVESLEELAIDNPKVVEGMALLMAKLVERGVITCEAIRLISSRARANADKENKSHASHQCYEDALTFASNRALLNGKLAPSGGHQPIDVLSAQFKMILKEFVLASNDKEAASLRVEELKVPHFNHEFVYQTGLMALEQMHDAIMKKLAQLLKHMFENGMLAETCLRKGYERLYASLGDLCLDLPAAYALAKRWVSKSLTEEVINAELAELCPEKARSRTLSEGPDGKLSVEDGEVDAHGVASNTTATLCNGHSKAK